MNDASSQASSKDIKYLVNCGNSIDERQSITGEAPVHRAVLSSKADKNSALTAIIDCNADLDILDSNGWTALIHACYTGDLESAKTLLQNGAKVNAFSNQQKQALHFAALKDSVPCIRLLLQNRAKLEAKDNQGCTPLHLACKKGCQNSVSVLLSHGANIYAVDEREWTPLHYAAYNGYPQVCKQLLSFSADTDPKLRDAVNSQNKTAFNICKNPPTKLGFRIIWRAAKQGDLDMVRILIREGCDFNEQTVELKNSPLHLAAK